MVAIPAITTKPAIQTSKHPQIAFGSAQALPFSVVLQNNGLLNRGFIDMFGYTPFAMGVARNMYERIEVAFDMLTWLLFGLIAPVVVDKALNQKLSKKITEHPNFKPYFQALPSITKPLSSSLPWFQRLGNHIGQMGRSSVFRIPLEWLHPHFRLNNPEQQAHWLKEIGLSPKALNTLLQKDTFRRQVLRGKLAILLLDMSLIMFSGLLAMWGKNAITRQLSGKKGFSGEFKYADKTYLEEKSQNYEKNKKKRFWLSVGMNILGTVSLPLLLHGLLATPKQSQFLNTLRRKFVPLFNYSNAIFMSKWVAFWVGLYNWLLLGTLTARDGNERREHLVRVTTAMLLHNLGDDLFGGWRGKLLEKKHQKLLTENGIRLVQKGNFGLWSPISLQKVLTALKTKTDNPMSHPIYKIARLNYWLSLLFATMTVGALVPLGNYWFTKQKVLAEMKSRQPIDPRLYIVPLNRKPSFYEFGRLAQA